MSSLVLELCEDSLDKIIERKRSMCGEPLRGIAKWTLGLCAEMSLGLARIHFAGIMHRDIKPSNILVCKGEVRIGDFGFACRDEGIVHLRTETPHYMAPRF